MDGQQEYWFCVKHHRVETGDDLCQARHRLGPYPTEAEATRALESAVQRNEAWDNDPAWNDEDDLDSGDAAPREG